MNRLGRRIAGALALLVILLTVCALALPSTEASLSAKNLVLLGWDGVQWNHLNDLLEAGRLPHLAKLQAEGSFVHALVTDHATDTKSGWVQICSGLPAKASGTFSNGDYRPMPAGATLFERLERESGGAVFTCFIAGKSHNLGSLGPGVKYRAKRKVVNTSEGEPWFNARNGFDLWFGDRHREADEVGTLLTETLAEYGPPSRFAVFAHFADPDSSGHRFGENSAEYEEAIIACDRWLGEVRARLEKLGLAADTVVAVVTDHGFDEGAKQHRNAPDLFFAVNAPGVTLPRSDMQDFAPVLLRLIGGD